MTDSSTRQTTYWEVRAARGAVYRIHFRDKVEVGFCSAAYAGAEIVSFHPLLVQYDEPSRSLYFSGTPFNPRIVAENLDRVIRAASADWRKLSDYAGGIDAVERRLRTGHGMLMGGPESVCGSVAQTLEAAGVGACILGIAAPRPGNRVLLLGRNDVVATAFVFEGRRALGLSPNSE